MSTPKRIQRRRTKGWKAPAGSIYVGRPTVFGNPWRVGDPGTEQACVDEYRAWLNGEVWAYNQYAFLKRKRTEILAALPSLRGHDLSCWCAEGSPCHADVLLELANQEPR